MKIKVYVIAQAFAKTFQGLKTPDNMAAFEAFVVFLSKESAYSYLRQVVERRRHEIGIGLRDDFNLDPDVSLDFCISEAEIEINEERMRSKDWTFPTKIGKIKP